MYGPTEAAIEVTYFKSDGNWERPVLPIGRPITNAQLFILDKHLNLVPRGVTGDLYVGGVSLGRGYINKPDLTAEAFIPSPFSNEAGARLYRTGDLARFLPDGNIEFVGRSDHQVKIRGFRVELAEIEAVLLSHPEIEATTVIDDVSAAGERRLVAYLVAKSKASPKVEDLRAFAGQTLPAYMVPSAFVLLDQLPLLPNGKIDRAALPEPESESTETYVAPSNEVETLIAGVWADVLERERVSVTDDFFALGGDSLTATQVMARLFDVFHVDLGLRSLFESPTVAALAESVSAAVLCGTFI